MDIFAKDFPCSSTDGAMKASLHSSSRLRPTIQISFQMLLWYPKQKTKELLEE